MIQVMDIPEIYIVIAAGVVLLIIFIMKALSMNFLTLYVFVRAFKIFDLEFAASPLELATYVKGIFDTKLPESVSKKSCQSLRKFLILSIICQVLIAVVLFLACIKIAELGFYKYLFLILGWAQLVSMIFGVFRAQFFLQYIHKDAKVLSDQTFKRYQFVEIIKWSIPLFTCVIIAAFFFYVWFSGLLTSHLLFYVLILIGEGILVMILNKYFFKSKEVNLEPFVEIGN